MRSTCLFLAGGNSKRTPIPKGLILHNEMPWLLNQLQELEEQFAGELTIVLGFHSEAYLKNISKLATLKTVLNPKPENGQFSSLLVGLESLKSYDAVFVLPLDVPCPKKAVWQALKKNLKNHSIVIPCYQSQGGHPVLLSQAFTETLKSVPVNSAGARLDRQIHLEKKSKIFRLDVEDPKVMVNLNTEKDFKDFRNRAF